jgi:hypothetical protein
VLGDVDEPACAEPPGRDEQMGRHREEAEDSESLADAIGAAGHDEGEAPDRDPPPTRRGWEEGPVAKKPARGGVGDVVGGEAEALDPQQRLAGARRGQRALDQPGGVQVVLRDFEVELHGASVSRPIGICRAP